MTTLDVARVTDTPFAEEPGNQGRKQRLQRRDLLRAGQTRVSNSLGQIEVQQQRKEKEETGYLSEELPSFAERQFSDVSNIGHYGTVVGELALYDV